MLTPEAFAQRYTAEQIARALNVGADVVHTMLGTPPDVDADALEALRRAASDARVRIETAIGDAAGEVASAVGVRWDWARVQDAPLCLRLVADRAIAYLHGEIVPDDLEQRRSQAVVTMGMLRKGTRTLVDAQGVPYPARATLRVRAPKATLSGKDGLLEAY